MCRLHFRFYLQFFKIFLLNFFLKYDLIININFFVFVVLSRDSGFGKDKEAVANSVSKIEDAVKTLSHISLALSTGSTDL